MQYGLIGEKLGHSFSKIIHESLADDEYELVELQREQLADFLTAKDFAGINVTIPYKQAVIPFLDEVEPAAAKIGAVNTIVNSGGKLKGYNTDYRGLQALIQRHNVNLSGKRVVILGSGGTSLTARQVAEDMGAASVVRVSRSSAAQCISYPEMYRDYSDTQVIINTTPVGMYPQVECSAVDLAAFKALEAVFDVVYNPLRTDLVLAAQERSLIAAGGLYMLVAQAVYARELFTAKPCAEQTFESVYTKLRTARQNIVLAGMPGSGKSTVGAILAQALGRELIDTDAMISREAQMPVSEIFARFGEAHFRELESRIVREVSLQPRGCIIALGGGAVLDKENVRALKRSGKIYFIDRAIEDIVPTADRPLALDKAALQQRYEERYEIYRHSADKRIQVTTAAAGVADAIRKDYLSED